MRTRTVIRNPWWIFWQAESYVTLTEDEAKAFGNPRITGASKIGKKHFSLDKALDEAHKLRKELIEQYTTEAAL